MFRGELIIGGATGYGVLVSSLYSPFGVFSVSLLAGEKLFRIFGSVRRTAAARLDLPLIFGRTSYFRLTAVDAGRDYRSKR
jgi:hypothetical protein